MSLWIFWGTFIIFYFWIFIELFINIKFRQYKSNIVLNLLFLLKYKKFNTICLSLYFITFLHFIFYLTELNLELMLLNFLNKNIYFYLFKSIFNNLNFIYNLKKILIFKNFIKLKLLNISLLNYDININHFNDNIIFIKDYLINKIKQKLTNSEIKLKEYLFDETFYKYYYSPTNEMLGYNAFIPMYQNSLITLLI
jgi:hypothetical protein